MRPFLPRKPPFYPRTRREGDKLIIESFGSLPALTWGAVLGLAGGAVIVQPLVAAILIVPLPTWLGWGILVVAAAVMTVAFRRRTWQLHRDGTGERKLAIVGIQIVSEVEQGCEILTAPIKFSRGQFPDFSVIGVFVFSRTTCRRECIATDRDRTAIERWTAALEWPVRHETVSIRAWW